MSMNKSLGQSIRTMMGILTRVNY